MPKITDVTLQTNKKNRCNLFVDGEFFCGVSLETVMKFRLKAGLDIETEELDRLIKENERAEALAKAVDYLSKRLKTKREVKDYLLKKGYSEDVCWYCVDKLKDYGYVNDEDYSKRYIESVSKKQGRRLTEYKLMMKGVRKEDINSAFDQTEVDDKDNALRLAEKHIKNKEINKENLAKTYRYLIGKGFNHEQAGFAIDKLKEEV